MKHFCRIFFEEFSANLLLSLRELCHRLKLTLADQDVLNLVGGSQKMFLEICIVQQKKQVGAQSPWLIQPLPCRWNYHTWTVRSNQSNASLMHYFGASQHESEPFVLQASLPLNHLKESDIQSYVFNLLFQCRKARFESKFISRMRFYHLNFVFHPCHFSFIFLSQAGRKKTDILRSS